SYGGLERSVEARQARAAHDLLPLGGLPADRRRAFRGEHADAYLRGSLGAPLPSSERRAAKRRAADQQARARALYPGRDSCARRVLPPGSDAGRRRPVSIAGSARGSAAMSAAFLVGTPSPLQQLAERATGHRLWAEADARRARVDALM